MMQGVATVFIANVYGIDLGITDYLMVVLIATLASMGTAAVPGVGLVMLTMVLTQVGLPAEGIALIIGVDRLLDMMRTAANVTGDSAVAVIIARGEKAIDEKVFNDMSAGSRAKGGGGRILCSCAGIDIDGQPVTGCVWRRHIRIRRTAARLAPTKPRCRFG